MKKNPVEDEIRKIKEDVEKEFPDDPALQNVHIARKIIAKESKRAGMSYLEYIKSWRKKQEGGVEVNR